MNAGNDKILNIPPPKPKKKDIVVQKIQQCENKESFFIHSPEVPEGKKLNLKIFPRCQISLSSF